MALFVDRQVDDNASPRLPRTAQASRRLRHSLARPQKDYRSAPSGCQS